MFAPTAKSLSIELNAKVDEVTKANAQLHDDIKSISKMIAKNQKGMSSIAGMAESLQAVLMQIQKQSRQISGLKKETQGLFEELEEIGAQAGSVDSIASQMSAVKSKLQGIADEQKRRSESGQDEETAKKLDEGIKTIRENSEAIAKLANSIDKVRRETRAVAARSASAAGTGIELDRIRSEIEKITDVTQKGSIIGILRGEIEKITRRVDEIAAKSDIDRSQEITGALESISADASQIEKINTDIGELKDQMNSITSGVSLAYEHVPEALLEKLDHVELQVRSFTQNTEETSSMRDSVSTLQEKIGALKSEISQEVEKITSQISRVSEERHGHDTAAISEIRSEIDNIHAEIQGIRHAADGIHTQGSSQQTASVPDSVLEKLDHVELQVRSFAQNTEEVSSMRDSVSALQEKIGVLKSEISQEVERITSQISRVSEERQDHDTAAISEIRSEIGRIHETVKGVRGTADNTAAISSHDMEKLLRLSAFQSSIRLISESKYGSMKEISEMSRQTSDIMRLFVSSVDEMRMGLSQDTTAQTGPTQDKIPPEVSRWAISKILDCGDRWEIRFADIYAAIKESVGADAIKESLQMQQVRDIYGIRSVNMVKEDLGI